MAIESKLPRLIQLLTKIASSPRHIQLEIDWNGKEFRWRASIGGLIADEWRPQVNHSTTGVEKS